MLAAGATGLPGTTRDAPGDQGGSGTEVHAESSITAASMPGLRNVLASQPILMWPAWQAGVREVRERGSRLSGRAGCWFDGIRIMGVLVRCAKAAALARALAARPLMLPAPLAVRDALGTHRQRHRNLVLIFSYRVLFRCPTALSVTVVYICYTCNHGDLIGPVGPDGFVSALPISVFPSSRSSRFQNHLFS